MNKKFFALVVASVMYATAAFAATTIASYEDLQRISSITIVELNNDGGRQALLTQDLLLSDGQFGYCGSNTLYGPGTVFYSNSLVYIYIKRAPNSVPTPAPTTPVSNDRPAPVTPADGLVTFANLGQYGKVTQRDSLWTEFVPYQDCLLDLAIFAAFDTNDFSNEIVGQEGQAAIGALKQGGHYLMVVRELFREFVPESDDDLALLAHPKIGVETGPVWTPEGRTIKNYYVVLAADWTVARNTEVLYNSDVRRAAGEVIPAGGKILVNVTPIKNDGDGVSRSDGEGGGGGCNAAGLGLPALALVGLALKKRR